MRYESERVAAARAMMWASDNPRECTECGAENPRAAPCCGMCGGELEGER